VASVVTSRVERPVERICGPALAGIPALNLFFPSLPALDYLANVGGGGVLGGVKDQRVPDIPSSTPYLKRRHAFVMIMNTSVII
jgi:hypothetical protein